MKPTNPLHLLFKRALCRLLLLGALSAWLFQTPGRAQTGRTAKAAPPNILFVMADDLGYGDLGSYGQTVIRTPHLDQLAADGLRFTDVYSGSPVCAPARSVLMTGQHTGHATVRGNFGQGGVRGLAGGEGRVPLRDEDLTVAEVLQEAGYTTGMIGKWGLGEPGTSGEPNNQGFDYFFGYLNQRRAHDYYPSYIWRNQEKVVLEGNLKAPKTDYTHDLFAEDALNFIRKHHDDAAPFFLYLPYTIPHDKYQIPSTDSYSEKDWTADEKVHAAMITRMDKDIGRMMALLKSLDIDDNTIVFFTSDNGAARRWERRFDSSGPLRGRKRDVYEGGIRVPMIVRWPGQIEADQVSDSPWYHADVLPTLGALAGVPAPGNIDGVSVLLALLGQSQDLGERPMYWEFHERGYQQAVRWGKWKAVRPQYGKPLELYDLSVDLREANDIAAAHPDVIERMETYLKTARTESKAWPIKRR